MNWDTQSDDDDMDNHLPIWDVTDSDDDDDDDMDIELDIEEDIEDQSLSPDDSPNNEYAAYLTDDIHKDFQCLICLGIIRRTRTVKECIHRFCKDCIEKSMRLGNNECPTCRRHLSSRRSLRDDPKFDALIAAFFPDIEKYEAEEMASLEDNAESLQAMQKAYHETLQRQRKALEKQRVNNDASASVVRRTQDETHGTNLRRRSLRNNNGVEITEQPNNSGGNNENINVNEINDGIEFVPAESGGRGGEVEAQIPQRVVVTTTNNNNDVVVAANGYSGQHHNVPAPDPIRDLIISSFSTLVWGRNGQRSNTRTNSNNAIAARNNRISRLVRHLRNSTINDDELDVFIKLVSLEERRVPNLPRPYLCCRPTLSIGQLCQYVAFKTSLQTEEIELYLVKECDASIITGDAMLDPNRSELEFLTREEETMSKLVTDNILCCGYLVIAYRRKMWNLNEAFPSAQ